MKPYNIYEITETHHKPSTRMAKEKPEKADKLYMYDKNGQRIEINPSNEIVQ